MTINGIELEFSIFDADCVEKYENAIKRMMDEGKELPEESSTADAIRRECEIYIRFFDDVFGDGTAYKIFNGRTNLAMCHDAFYALMDEIEAEGEEQRKVSLARHEKYGAENWRDGI